MSKGFSKGSPSARAKSPLSFQMATEDESGELETLHDEAPDSRGDLLATIREQIVPRLMLAHASTPPGVDTVCVDERLSPTTEEISELARIATTSDLCASLAFVERLASEGLTFESLLLDLVAPASAKLGADWQDDLRSFTEVTVGLGTLQQIVNVLGPTYTQVGAQTGFVVLVAAPGEQHTLGLYLLGELLRRAGWSVHVAPTMSEADLVDLVSTEKVDMVGFSVSGTTVLKPLARTIAAVKRATKNASTLIMLGGGLELSSFASQVGATYCADAREAVRWLEHHGNVAESGQSC